MQVGQLRARTHAALLEHRRHEEDRVSTVNEQLDALAAMDLRAIARHALRDGISARPGSGQPHQTAVSQGAMLIAQALHRDGVQAGELLPLLGLWQQRIDATDLLAAAEQLLGEGFRRLDFPRGTPLADLCETLFGRAQEVGDLYAAGGVVRSIHRKLEWLERQGQGLAPLRPRKPFVRRYTAGRDDGGTAGTRPRPG
jgi:hypothetical protein